MKSSTSKSAVNILESSKTLFWKYGIKKVNVEDISSAAGVSKMTFYRHFSNKEELVGILLNDLMEKGYEDYIAIMEKNISFEKKLRKIIDYKKLNSKAISTELLKDIFASQDTTLLSLMQTHRERSNGRFQEDLRKAQKTGELKKGLKIEFIMYMLDSLFHLMADKKLIDLFDDSEDASAEITNFFFYGMLQAKK